MNNQLIVWLWFCSVSGEWISMLLLLHYLPCLSFIYIYFQSRRIQFSRDVDKNPWSKSMSDQSFWICHWNLNSIVSCIFSKMQSVIAYNCNVIFILFVFLKCIWVLRYHLIMRIWKYQVVDCSDMIIVVFVFVCFYFLMLYSNTYIKYFYASRMYQFGDHKWQ